MTARPTDARREVHLVELTAMPEVRYSITLGYLEAAARSAPDIDARCVFRKHVHHQQADRFDATCAEVLAGMDAPLMVAFTVYFWNRAQSLELARRVKQRWPRCVVVLGGNDVTNDADALFAEAPHVDVLVHGEGELRFRELIRRVLAGAADLSDVRGITWWSTVDGERSLVTTRPAERIADLTEVPSPLLSDVYSDADLAASRMIVYETNRGCPYSCAFCYWGGATKSKVRQFPLERVYAELERIVRVVEPGTSIFLADANFGILARDVDIARYFVDACARHGKRVLMLTNWAKNTSDRVVEIAHMLHSAGLTGAITLSAQSFDEEVLRIAHRSNIRINHYRRLQARFRELGVPTYTDIIWGMPGESYDTYVAGIEEVLSAGGSPMVYPLLLLNNTDYTQETFRTEHRLRARRMSCDVSNPELVADVVVEHARMSFDDWLRGMELRLALVLFQKALLRCTLQYLHTVSGVRLVDLLELLRGYLADACTDPVVTTVARNFTEAWRDPDRMATDAILARLPDFALAEELHYQAILHHVVSDPDRLRGFLAEAVDFCYDRLAGRPLPDRELLDAVTSLDLAGAAVFRTSILREPQEAEFEVPAAALPVLRDSGCLPAHVDGDLPAGIDGTATVRGRLRVPPFRAHYAFSAYALSVWHANGHPLRDGIIAVSAAVP